MVTRQPEPRFDVPPTGHDLGPPRVSPTQPSQPHMTTNQENAERTAMNDAGNALADVSQWLDDAIADRAEETILWIRVGKIAEELGEATQALVGATGVNPRKGTTHTMDDVRGELLDVALTALCAYEHLSGNHGIALSDLEDKILAVASRAGLTRWAS